MIFSYFFRGMYGSCGSLDKKAFKLLAGSSSPMGKIRRRGEKRTKAVGWEISGPRFMVIAPPDPEDPYMTPCLTIDGCDMSNHTDCELLK